MSISSESHSLADPHLVFELNEIHLSDDILERISYKQETSNENKRLIIRFGSSGINEQLHNLLELWYAVAITHKSVLKITKDDLFAANGFSEHFPVRSGSRTSNMSFLSDSYWVNNLYYPGLHDTDNDDDDEDEDNDSQEFATPPSKRSVCSHSSVKVEPAMTGECSKTVSNNNKDDTNEGEDELATEMIFDFLMTLHEEIFVHILFDPDKYLPSCYLPIFKHLLKITEMAASRSRISDSLVLERVAVPYDMSTWNNEGECSICFEVRGLFERSCCEAKVCEKCFARYLTSNIEDEGRVSFTCPNSGCNQALYLNEVLFRLSKDVRKKLDAFSVNACNDHRKKTCPRCNFIHALSDEEEKQAKTEQDNAKLNSQHIGLNVICPNCSLKWCFSCHAPDHQGMSCKEYRNGDKKLREWANQIIDSAYKARFCPKCKVLIERSEGCPHMTCNQCNVEWCYDCGRRYRSFFLLGDHSKRFSVFGCKKTLCKNNKHARRFIRGSILTLELIAIVGTCGLGLGAYFAVKKIKDNCWRCC